VPSPLGHAFTGLAVGWLTAPADCRELPGTRAPGAPRPLAAVRRWKWPLAFAAAGVAADLDLLFGLHSRHTHSLGAAALVFGASWLALRRFRRRAAAAAFALAAAYASHVLLDFLATDTTPPLGIMALWPFSSGFYVSPVPLFMGISRRYWTGTAWTQNAVSVAWELLVLVPLAGLAFRARTRSKRSENREG
jgi:membrane-bound metal-dependent hydrolase YbcI (DUF457 family)